MSEPTRSPRIRLHKNGHVTISGINYRDARDLLNSAWLYRSENRVEKQPEDPNDRISVRNHRLEVAWERRQFYILNEIERRLNAQIAATHPQGPEPTLKERLKAAHAERLHFRGVIKWLIARKRTKALAGAAGS